MNSSPAPNIPPPAIDLAHLLPVIRQYKLARRSFRMDPVGQGIAVYRDCIIYFKSPRKRDLPESAFVDDSGRALLAVPGVKLLHRLQLEDIVACTARRSGLFAVLRVVERSKKVEVFRIARWEARHLIAAIDVLLGERSSSDLAPADYLPPSNRTGLLALVVAILMAFAGLALVGLAIFGDDWGIFETFPSDNDTVPDLLFASMSLWGCLLLFGGAGFLANEQIARKAHKRLPGQEPFRAPSLAKALKATGFILFAAGAVHDLFFASGRMQDAGTDTMGTAATFIGGSLLYLGYRFGLQGGRTTLQEDARPQVLFLRSFGDDGKNNLNPDSKAAKILGLRPFGWLIEKLGPVANLYPPRLFKLVLGIVVDTAEEQLAIFFKRYGPFLAIGKPGEVIATGGADRLYVTNAEWQNVASGLIDRSAGVVLQPANTQGVWWEIETCLKRVEAGHLVFCVTNFRSSQQAYEEFRLHLMESGYDRFPRTLAGCQFLWLDESGNVHLLPDAVRSPFLWPLLGLGLDLKETLHPFLKKVHPEKFAAAPKTMGRRSVAFQKFAAVVLWGAALYGGNSALGTVRGISRQTAALDATELVERSGDGFSWILPVTWKPEIVAFGSCYSVGEGVAIAEVQRIPIYGGTETDIAEKLCKNLGSSLDQTVRSTREISGQTWQRFELECDPPGQLRQIAIVDIHCGSDSAWIVAVTGSHLAFKFQSSKLEKLRNLSGNFHIVAPD